MDEIVETEQQKVNVDLTPGEMFGGFYKDWRKYQHETALMLVDWVLNRPERFCSLEASTGTGKSLIAAATAVLAGRRAVMLTSTIALQEQYERSFESGVVGLVKGKDRFICDKDRDEKAESGIAVVDDSEILTAAEASGCRDCMYRRVSRCSYYNAFHEGWREASHSTVNYSKWGTMIRDRSSDDRLTLLVCDEADMLLSVSTKEAEVELTSRRLDDLIGVGLYPYGSDDTQEWLAFIGDFLPRLKTRFARLEGMLESGIHSGEEREHSAGEIKSMGREKVMLESLIRRMDGVMEYAKSGSELVTVWSERRGIGRVTISPVYPRGIFQEKVAWKQDKVLLMTATPPSPDFLETFLGIKPDDLYRVRVPSTFPAERAPIERAAGAVDTSYSKRQKNPELWDEWVALIDKAVKSVWQSKGTVLNDDANILLYVRSETNRDAFLEKTSLSRSRILWYNTQERNYVIQEFEKSKGKLLVGTGVERGLDFAGEKCSAIIVAKLPENYNPSDKLAMARNQGYASYCSELNAGDFAQVVGRGMRSVDDVCVTLLVDAGYGYWASKCKIYLPTEVTERLEQEGPFSKLMAKVED